jgi:hypothetical protein
VGYPAGWYCLGLSTEDAGSTREYLGRSFQLRAEGPNRVRVFEAERELRAEVVAGLVLAWVGEGAPTEVPWDRLRDPAWAYNAPRPRRVKVSFERPFGDYFDHWHTRSFHRIPISRTSVWFERDRCGVRFDAWLSAGYAEIPLRDHIPLRLPSSSQATLFGMSFAVDELRQAGLDLVNLQSTTPVSPTEVEIHTVVGLRSRLPGFVKAPVLRAIDATVAREVARDLVYWGAFERGETFDWDAETRRDYARYLGWCRELGWTRDARASPGAQSALTRSPSVRSP